MLPEHLRETVDLVVDEVVVLLLVLVLEKTSLDQLNKVSQVATKVELMVAVAVVVPVVLV
jgi:hypothetical protein